MFHLKRANMQISEVHQRYSKVKLSISITQKDEKAGGAEPGLYGTELSIRQITSSPSIFPLPETLSQSERFKSNIRASSNTASSVNHLFYSIFPILNLLSSSSTFAFFFFIDFCTIIPLLRNSDDCSWSLRSLEWSW